MDAIKDIAFAFCAAAIISAAVGLLCGNRLQKSMRYIISLTLICTVISVAVGKKFTFFSSAPSQNNISYNEMPLYEYQAEYLVADILKKEGIEFENITAKFTLPTRYAKKATQKTIIKALKGIIYLLFLV